MKDAGLKSSHCTFYWDGRYASAVLCINKVEINSGTVRIHWSLIRAGTVHKSTTGYFAKEFFIAVVGVSEYTDADPANASWWDDAYDEGFRVMWQFGDVVLAGEMDIVSLTNA